MPHGIYGLPAFDVALGCYFLNELFLLKGGAPRVTALATDRLFGVFAPGYHAPLCYNIALPATPVGDADELVDA